MNTLTLIIDRFNLEESKENKMRWLEEVRLIVDAMISDIGGE